MEHNEVIENVGSDNESTNMDIDTKNVQLNNTPSKEIVHCDITRNGESENIQMKDGYFFSFSFLHVLSLSMFSIYLFCVYMHVMIWKRSCINLLIIYFRKIVFTRQIKKNEIIKSR